MRRLILAALLLLVSAALSAGTGRWTPAGPFGGSVSDVQFHRTDPTVAYASGLGGFFRSLDGGQNWERAERGLPPRDPASALFALSAAAPDRIYITYSRGVARSNNRGANFAPTDFELAMPEVEFISHLAASPSDANTVALILNNEQIFLSSNGGATFNSIGVANGIPTALVISNEAIYVGTAGGPPAVNRITRFPLATLSGQNINLSTAANAVLDLRIAPGNTLFAVTTDAVEAVALGLNGPTGSFAVRPALPAPSRLAFTNSSNGNSITAAGPGTLLTSTDGGATLASTQALPVVNGTAPFIASIAAPVASPANFVLLGSENTGFFRTADNGQTYTRPNQGYAQIVVPSFSLSSTDDLYAAVDTTLGRFGQPVAETFFKRPGLNNPFVPSDDALPLIAAAATVVDPTSPLIVFAAGRTTIAGDTGSIQKSLDGGATWSASSSGIPVIEGPQFRFTELIYDERSCTAPPATGPCTTGPLTTVYAIGPGAIFFQPDPNRGMLDVGRIYRSTDGGATWALRESGIDMFAGSDTIAVTALAIDPNNSNILYAGTAVSPFANPMVANGLHKSVDAGATWTQVGLGLPRNGPGNPFLNITAVAVDPDNTSRVFVSLFTLDSPFDPTSHGVYLSVDGGANFVASDLTDIDITQLDFDSGTPRRLYATSFPEPGTPGLVLYSTDGGDNWDSASLGFPDIPTLDFAVDRSNPSQLYASNEFGVFAYTRLADDNDEDGAPASIEDGAPNNGDGNDDGMPDSAQNNVASVQLGELGMRGRSNYVTGSASPTRTAQCAQMADVEGLDSEEFPPDLTGFNDTEYEYPLGVITFTLPNCANATVDIKFHDGEFNDQQWRWRNYGPTTPGVISTADWYTFTGATRLDATTWRLTIAANAQGNWRSDTTSILFVGGPSFTDLRDFGDAPDSYGTTLAASGANHFPVGLTLGNSRDFEDDGQPNAGATGDGADEDGVTLPNPIVASTNNAITVQASAAGFLSAWVDLNRDGDFTDAGERVFTNTPVVAGSNGLTLNVQPFSLGNSFARFRLTAAAVTDPLPTGTFLSGEVEDYAITLGASGASYSIDGPTVTEGNAGPATLRFTVTYSGPGPSGLTVVSADGSATVADSDYVALASTTLNFAGAGSQFVDVTVNGDTQFEPDEDLLLVLSNPTNGAFAPPSGRGVITSDDLVSPTTTGLASSANPSVFGQSVMLTATVTGSAPAGTVEFLDAASVIGSAALGGNGNTRTATLATSTLALGNRMLSARYLGNATNMSSASSTLAQVVNQAATAVTLTVAANPATAGSVSFTATVAAAAPSTAPVGTGIVTISQGALNCQANLVAGVGSCALNLPTSGLFTVAANYPGDSTFLPSSGERSVVVNSPGDSTDLRLRIGNGQALVIPGSMVAYQIVVENLGAVASAARVTAAVGTGLSSPTWTCSPGSAGSSCLTPSGIGPLSVDGLIPAAGFVLVTLNLTATAVEPSAVSQSATVASLGLLTDPVPGNNSATDTDAIGLFGSSFEGANPDE